MKLLFCAEDISEINELVTCGHGWGWRGKNEGKQPGTVAPLSIPWYTSDSENNGFHTPPKNKYLMSAGM